MRVLGADAVQSGLQIQGIGAAEVDALAGDDFYRDMPEEQRWTLTATQGVAEYFDWQRLRHEVLEPLRAGRAARPELRDLVDLTVLVETPADIGP